MWIGWGSDSKMSNNKKKKKRKKRKKRKKSKYLDTSMTGTINNKPNTWNKATYKDGCHGGNILKLTTPHSRYKLLLSDNLYGHSNWQILFNFTKQPHRRHERLLRRQLLRLWLRHLLPGERQLRRSLFVRSRDRRARVPRWVERGWVYGEDEWRWWGLRGHCAQEARWVEKGVKCVKRVKKGNEILDI